MGQDLVFSRNPYKDYYGYLKANYLFIRKWLTTYEEEFKQQKHCKKYFEWFNLMPENWPTADGLNTSMVTGKDFEILDELIVDYSFLCLGKENILPSINLEDEYEWVDTGSLVGFYMNNFGEIFDDWCETQGLRLQGMTYNIIHRDYVDVPDLKYERSYGFWTPEECESMYICFKKIKVQKHLPKEAHSILDIMLHNLDIRPKHEGIIGHFWY